MINNNAFVGLAAIIFLCSCASPMIWKYSAFSEQPEIKLERAKLICNGAASSAHNSIGKEIAPANIQCNAYSTSVSCQNNNGYAQAAANIRANQRKRGAANTAYISCMAQNGWKAYLSAAKSKTVVSKPVSEREMVKCRRKDGGTIKTKILLETCTKGYGGTPIEEGA